MLHVDVRKIGNLYTSLGDAILESSKGAASLSQAENDALDMLQCQLENMLAHVRNWASHAEPRRLSDELIRPGIGTKEFDTDPAWFGESNEANQYGRN